MPGFLRWCRISSIHSMADQITPEHQSPDCKQLYIQGAVLTRSKWVEGNAHRCVNRRFRSECKHATCRKSHQLSLGNRRWFLAQRDSLRIHLSRTTCLGHELLMSGSLLGLFQRQYQGTQSFEPPVLVDVTDWWLFYCNFRVEMPSWGKLWKRLNSTLQAFEIPHPFSRRSRQHNVATPKV